MPDVKLRRQLEVPVEPAMQELETPVFSPGEFRRKLIERLRLLWDERRFLLKVTAMGLAVGIVGAFLIPKEYQSTAQLMPPDSQPASGLMLAALTAGSEGGSGAGGALGAVAGDLLGLKSSGALFVGILHSRTLEQRIVERFNLTKVYRVKLAEDACAELAKHTVVSEDRKTGIINITVTEGDPQRAAAIAQDYVSELNRLVSELSTSAAHRERVFLEERLKAVKLELDRASHDFSEFASKNAAIDIKEQGKAMVGASATLEGELIAAQSQLKGLEQIYTPNNVRVRSVQARITELQRQLRNLGGKDPNDKTGESSDSADSNDALFPSLRQIPILGVTYADLFRRSRIQETVYESLTREYEMAKVQEAKETPSVKILDAASVPERKSFPPRLLIMVLCSLLAAGGGMFWIFLRVRWERTDAADPGKVLAREVVSSVNQAMPWATPNGSRVQAMTHDIWFRLVQRRGHGGDQE